LQSQAGHGAADRLLEILSLARNLRERAADSEPSPSRLASISWRWSARKRVAEEDQNALVDAAAMGPFPGLFSDRAIPW